MSALSIVAAQQHLGHSSPPLPYFFNKFHNSLELRNCFPKLFKNTHLPFVTGKNYVLLLRNSSEIRTFLSNSKKLRRRPP